MIRTIAAMLVLVTAGCALDPAEREYIEALRGEETGMSRQEQIAHIDRAIAQAPDRPHYWETRGIYHIDLREFAEAIADVDRAIRAIEANGGRMLSPKAHIPTVGTVAYFLDTEGNIAAVIQPVTRA